MALSQRGLKILITGGVSGPHSWNLVFLELLLGESGRRAVDLGPCVCAALQLRECRAHAPDLVAVSSADGHGYRDGLSVIGGLRAEPALAGVPVVIGGRLGVDGGRDEAAARRLIAAGYAAVFDDAHVPTFLDRMSCLAERGWNGL